MNEMGSVWTVMADPSHGRPTTSHRKLEGREALGEKIDANVAHNGPLVALKQAHYKKPETFFALCLSAGSRTTSKLSTCL